MIGVVNDIQKRQMADHIKNDLRSDFLNSTDIQTELAALTENSNKITQKRNEDQRRRNKLSDDANMAQIESREILKDIEENTSYLKDMVQVLNESNEKQEEMLEIYKEILAFSNY